MSDSLAWLAHAANEHDAVAISGRPGRRTAQDTSGRGVSTPRHRDTYPAVVTLTEAPAPATREPTTTQPFTVRLPDDLMAALKTYSKLTETPMSDVIRSSVVDYLRAHDGQLRTAAGQQAALLARLAVETLVSP